MSHVPIKLNPLSFYVITISCLNFGICSLSYQLWTCLVTELVTDVSFIDRLVSTKKRLARAMYFQKVVNASTKHFFSQHVSCRTLVWFTILIY
jgi:hypothetical protein